MSQEEEKKYASQEDFEVQRNDNDEIIPVDVQLQDSEKYVKVKPITYGKANEEFSFEDPNDVPTEKLVKLIKDHIVRPDYGWIDVKHVNKKMKPMALGRLLQAIMEASGLEADVDISDAKDAKIDIEEGKKN